MRKILVIFILMIGIFVGGCINPKSDNSSITWLHPDKNNLSSKDLNISKYKNVENLGKESNNLGVFYYMWAGGNPQKSPYEQWLHWKDGKNNPPNTWSSNYLPDYSNGFDPYNDLYASNDTNIIEQQLNLMNKAGINFVIASWWGQNHISNRVLDNIFNNILTDNNSNYKNLKFCIYYEKDGFTDVPKSEIINDINYIKNKYGNSPYYYKIDGRPVVFVYNTKSGRINSTSEEDAQKWKEVRDETGIYLVLKIFPGYQKVEGLADSWHEYAPATNFKTVWRYSAYISPGFYKWNEGQPRLAREDFNRFENDVKSLKNTDVQFRLIETWNEWGEGTGIEPAMKINRYIKGYTPDGESYGTKYIDILAKYFAAHNNQ